MTWAIMENSIGYPHIGAVETKAHVPVGTIVKAQHADGHTGEFIFCEGVASTVVGSAVLIGDDFKTTLLARDDIGQVGIATAATVASTYGWYQIGGLASVLSNDASDSGGVYSTTTAGTLDDAASTGNRVQNARYASDDDTSTGLATVKLWRPHVDDGLGSGT